MRCRQVVTFTLRPRAAASSGSAPAAQLGCRLRPLRRHLDVSRRCRRLGNRQPGTAHFLEVALHRAVACGRLAQVAVRTLREVYHVRHPGLLQYRAFAFDGPEIRFPALRIKPGRDRGSGGDQYSMDRVMRAS